MVESEFHDTYFQTNYVQKGYVLVVSTVSYEEKAKLWAKIVKMFCYFMKTVYHLMICVISKIH